MSALLWRVIIAVLCVALVLALIPPVFALIGFAIDANLLLVLRICIAGIALFYILKGPSPFPQA